MTSTNAFASGASQPALCFDRVMVGGLPVDVCSEADIVQLVSRPLPEGQRGRVMVDVNGHGLALASVDQSYRDAVLAADVIHADGQPIVWASRLLCTRTIPERTATTDLVHAVGRAAQLGGPKVYFLGSKQEAVSKAAQRFCALYGATSLAGFRDGYFKESELAQVADGVRRSGATVVFLGLGKPREQLFALKLADLLPGCWIITCGGCLDFLAGDAPRAPDWMQRFGLEWAYRLMDDPKRLAWRYLWTNVVATALLLSRTRRQHIARHAGVQA